MASITKVEMWKDIGFIDGGVEVPAVNAPAPTNPTFIIEPEEPIVPSRERFFSELKLKEFYSGMLDVGYLRLTYSMNNTSGVPEDMIFYGWVDSVSLQSDGDIPVTVIRWHIDEWRTYVNSAIFGSGHVKRRPYTGIDSTPIQNYPIRYQLKTDEIYPIISEAFGSGFDYDGVPVHWVMFIYNKMVEDTSVISYRCFPLGNGFSTAYFRSDRDSRIYHGLSLNDIYNGKFDEYYDINPQEMVGAWLCPFPPSYIFATSGSGTSSDPFVVTTSILPVSNDSEFASFSCDGNSGIAKRDFFPIGTTFISTEEDRIVLMSYDGNILLELPYGMSIYGYGVGLYIEADDVYLKINFYAKRLGDGKSDASLEGLSATLPLPALPINSNSWSEYVYSGGRQRDIDARNLATQEKPWSQGLTALTSGTIGGDPMKLLQTPLGVPQYMLETFWYNDEEQRILDREKSKQPPALITSSGSRQIQGENLRISLRHLIPDPYSLTQIQNMKTQLGVSVDELRVECDSLVRNASGYFNIQNLTVKGEIPVTAKQTIKRKFASGCRMIL